MTAAELEQELLQGGRICPLPMAWDRLYKLLGTHGKGAAGPPVPLILDGWHYSSDTDKRLRLGEQLRWAENNGALPGAADFLRRLGDADWYTGN